MRILLTGATGFLGNNLLRQLIDLGHQVSATIRISSDPRPLDGLPVDKIVLDLNQSHEVAQAMDDHDAVIHAAAMIQIGWKKLAQSRVVNVESTRTLAQCARRQGIRMVYVSTVDTLGVGNLDGSSDESCVEPPKPNFTYAVSKREAEQAFLDQVTQGLDGVVVSPGFMVGPWDWKPSSGQMMLAIAKQFIPLAPAGGCCVADVRQVAAGIIQALNIGVTGEKYILGGENLTYLDLWTRMANVMQRKPPIGKLPDWVAGLAGRAGDIAGRFMKDEPQVNSAATAMGQLHHWYSSEKAICELGYTGGNVDAALSDAWTWFGEHGYL